MDRIIEKLFRTIERLEALYQELLEYSQQKTDFLVNCDTEAIEQAQVREEMIIHKISQMERARTEALQTTADALNMKGEVTLTRIIEALEDQDIQEKLIEFRNNLKQVSEKLSSVNRLNEELCTQSLQHLEMYLGLLTGRDGRSATYDAFGKTAATATRALVNRSA